MMILLYIWKILQKKRNYYKSKPVILYINIFYIQIILNNENDFKTSASINNDIKPLLLQLQDKIKELGNSNETLTESLKVIFINIMFQSVVDRMKDVEKQRDHYKELYESQKVDLFLIIIIFIENH